MIRQAYFPLWDGQLPRIQLLVLSDEIAAAERLGSVDNPISRKGWEDAWRYEELVCVSFMQMVKGGERLDRRKDKV